MKNLHDFLNMNTSPYDLQPREVSIETLALCNANCTFCPYSTLERHGKKLCDADLLWLISEMKQFKHPFFISPFKVNEPFLDKRLLSFCRWIEEDLPLAKLRLFTNGSRFSDENLRELARLKNVQHLWISLNEVDDIVYKKTMNLNFRSTVERIDLAHAYARDFNFPVIISRVALSNQDSDADEAKARVRFSEYIARRWPRFKTFHIKRDGWLGYTNPSSDKVPVTPCSRWQELNIMADGNCALCCMDGKGEYKVGSIYESGLLPIYNQPNLLALRLGAKQRKDTAPCNRCTY